ncbi:NYN domain-containing protein [Candidatus Parcubacteria bacterium]|nr:NYN domain-containing protein [Patescibacteria group bacterium]MCG2695817.1 NYN domain-containing protein [Candidatus Parcubacteria bacterium]MCG2700599.1 NYN domain-containing protein [Candidatus Parcubacteria bacterium]
MTADILLDRSQIDEILLFSGDSDFDYLAKKLRDLGKKVVVFSSRKMLSWELKLTAQRYVFFEDLRERIERK